ncbi:DUF397 domain-containing protein [Actinocorallia lasiicapitis]
MTPSPQWRKSSYSNATSGDCVESAILLGSVGLRDSKHPEHGHHVYSRATYSALLNAIKAGHV